MFYLNMGYRWNMAEAAGTDSGAVLLASKNPRSRFGRRAPAEFSRLLFDPQLYLAGLDAESCGETCAKLAGYPWFGIDGVPDFDSEEMTQAQWKAKIAAKIAEKWPGVAPNEDTRPEACTACIELQMDLGCTHIILPAPLLAEREDEGAALGAWLDSSLAAAEELEVGQPLIASIAVSESTLSESAFEDVGYLNTLVDQVTSREGLEGAYIVVAQNGGGHPFQTPLPVLRAYVHLSSAFREAGYDFVLPNFADLCGLLCMAKGATGFANGPSHNLRRLSFADFKETGGGKAYPYFYSHPAAAEFATESDLNRIVKRKLFRRIQDITPASDALVSTLRNGGSAATVKAWVESQSNITAAQQHFVHCMAREGRSLTQLRDEDRRAHVLDWLESAEANQALIHQKLNPKKKLKGSMLPIPRYTPLLDESTEGDEEE